MRTYLTTLVVFWGILGGLSESQYVSANPWFSESGRYLAFFADSSNREVSVWELSSLREIRRVRIPERHGSEDFSVINSVSLSEENGLVACGTDNSLSIWGLQSGEMLWMDPEGGKVDGSASSTTHVAFLPGGERIISVSEFGGEFRICIRNTRDGSDPKFIGRHISGKTMEVSPDGKRVYAFGSIDDSRKEDLNCWDVDSGTLLGKFNLDDNRGRFKRFSVDNETLAEVIDYLGEDRGAYDKQLVLWDSTEFGELRRIRFRSGILATPFLLKGRESVLVTLSPNQNDRSTHSHAFYRMCEYSVHTGDVISEHLVPWGLDWGVESHGYGISPIPGTVGCCWMSSDDRSVLFLARRTPPLSHGFSLQLQAQEGKRNSSILIAGTGTGVVHGSPDTLELYSRNPQVNKEEWSVNAIGPKQVRQDSMAVHKIMKSVLEPLPATKQVTRDPSKPRLYLMTVGVSEYEHCKTEGSRFRSNASLIQSFLGKNLSGQFRDVQAKQLEDQQVTMKSLREGLSWVHRSPSDKDWVVIYLGGHSYVAEKGLYFAPHEGDEADLHQTCMNWSEISDSLLKSSAAHVVMLLDCDHAGSFAKIRRSNQDAFAKKLEASEKLIILASCGEDESSMGSAQDPKYGLFAKSLFDGLGGNADVNSDGLVTDNELLSFTEKKVSAETNGNQKPVRLKSSSRSFTLKVNLTNPK